MPSATFLYADTTLVNTSWYRIHTPAKYLRKAGHTIHVAHKSHLRTEIVTDTLLIERELSLSDIQTLRAMGFRRIVFTFDDAYHLIPSASQAFDYWKGSRRMIEEIWKVVGAVDCAVVPSRLLARDYNAVYLPNYHDPEMWGDIESEHQTACEGKIIIGWGGSWGHYLTWQTGTFAHALAKVVRENPQVELHMYGATADATLHTTGTPFQSFRWIEFEQWPEQVKGFDIGLAPLYGAYDMRRSNIKLVECGLAGIPWVATKAGEYSDAKGGVLVENGDKDWYRALSALVRNEEMRREFAREGRAWAKRYLMPDRVGEYESVLWH